METDRVSPSTIAISFGESHDKRQRTEIEARAAWALASFGTKEVRRIAIGSNSLILSSCPHKHVALRRRAGLVLHGARILTRNGDAIDAKCMLRRWTDAGVKCLEEFEPPFVVLVTTDDEVIAATDAIGLAHLFAWKGKNCAIVATSAAVIAKTVGSSFDFDGLFEVLTVGHNVGESTRFRGVKLIPGGCSISLKDGVLNQSTRNLVPLLPTNYSPQSYAERGRTIVQESIACCLRACPDCGIELSGGIDSRMVLAAIPSHERQGRTAYTIGYKDSPDVDVASRIANMCGLKHVIVDLEQFAAESPDTVWNRASRVAYRDDFATNVIDRLAIDCVDDVLISEDRIGGVNGELSRGFYYAGMRVGRPVTEEAADRLISWRLSVNDAAPRLLFHQDVLESCRCRLRDTIRRELMSGPGPLGNAMDHFYLHQRMRHWAGSAISRAILSRTVLVPFFQSQFVTWALNLPVREKKDSLAFSRILDSLDPRLASIELDSKLVPSQLACGGMIAALSMLQAKTGKLHNKVMQRIGMASRKNLGTDQFLSKLCQNEIVERINWAGLESVGIFDPVALNKLRTGGLPWSRVTLGQILALHFQGEYLAHGREDRNVRVIELAAPPSSS